MMRANIARSSGSQPSHQVRFKLQDADGSVFSVVSARQSTGLQLETRGNDISVARIASGESFTSDEIEMPVPTNTPVNAVLQLEIDNVHYHYSREDQVTISGLTSTRDIALIETAYYPEVTNITPTVLVLQSLGDGGSMGETNILISRFSGSDLES